jgi:hypothetical protein
MLGHTGRHGPGDGRARAGDRAGRRPRGAGLAAYPTFRISVNHGFPVFSAPFWGAPPMVMTKTPDHGDHLPALVSNLEAPGTGIPGIARVKRRCREPPDRMQH